MRITKRANIAVRVLMYCAAHADERITKTDIAGSCNASEHHLGQIVNQLAQLGYLQTWRGRYGGIALALDPEEVKIGRVFREFESSVPIAECFMAQSNTCPLVPACRLRPALALAGEAFFQVLDSVTLASLLDENDQLIHIFRNGHDAGVAINGADEQDAEDADPGTIESNVAQGALRNGSRLASR